VIKFNEEPPEESQIVVVHANCDVAAAAVHMTTLQNPSVICGAQEKSFVMCYSTELCFS